MLFTIFKKNIKNINQKRTGGLDTLIKFSVRSSLYNGAKIIRLLSAIIGNNFVKRRKMKSTSKQNDIRDLFIFHFLIVQSRAYVELSTVNYFCILFKLFIEQKKMLFCHCLFYSNFYNFLPDIQCFNLSFFQSQNGRINVCLLYYKCFNVNTYVYFLSKYVESI